MTHWGPRGNNGVCRYPEDPNQDDQGLHVFQPDLIEQQEIPMTVPTREAIHFIAEPNWRFE